MIEMNLPLFLSRRIHASQDDRCRVSRPAVFIATIGVAVGLAVMIVSVCVVFGFKHTIRDKVVGFGGHIQVAEFNTLLTSESRPVAMPDSMLRVLGRVHGVAHVQRYAMKQGILKTDDDFLGVSFKGVGQEYDTTFVSENLVDGAIPHFSDCKGQNKIVISKIMADKLKVKCGQRIFAYFIGDGGDVRVRRFTIAGIYRSNLTQYDKVTCYADLYTVVRLNGWQPDQVTGAEISVHDFDNVDRVEDDIVAKVNRTQDRYGNTYSSKTIREICPQIFSWLDLLDLNVWIILAIMTAVAVVTMISGLLIIILEQTAMIGLLKALGATTRTIRHTFLWLAVFIIGKGLLIGDAIALAIVLLQKCTGVVKLDAATYYVSTVPVEIDIPAMVLLNVATLLVSTLVLVVPSYLVSHIHPARSMRYE